MLLETAVADAYGAAFEFTKTPNIENDLSRFGSHPTGELPVGAYTDDTMRSMANTIVILFGDPYDWIRPESYISAICAMYASDSRAGWSKGFHSMLEAYKDKPPISLMRDLKRRSSNGCLMGVAPLGYISNTATAKLATTMQTISTHSAAAVPYAQIISLAAHYLIHHGESDTVLNYLVEEVEWANEAQIERFKRSLEDPPVPAMDADTIASGAIWALMNFDNQADILKWSCSRGGDTDSLAAVSIALASCAKDIAANLPRHLLDTVDTDENRREIIEADERLKAKFTR